MRITKEHTYGTHIYAEIELDNGEQHEIDVYIKENGMLYRTTGDNDEKKRIEIIRCFNKLY